MGRAKDQKKTEHDKLDTLIKKHEELIPNVQKTAVMVDLYWKCYAYGDELKPHVEFLDGIMLSSTRDIAPSCLENVDELIERQEKSLSQLDSKRNIVTDLIAKGKVILQNPDKPKFLEGHVKRIQDGWEDTKNKATDRLQLLTETKDAFIGYAENSETVANEFDIAEEEIKKVKKIFNLDAANADLSKRQEILKNTDDKINGLFSSINKHYNTMAITIPDDKKKILQKEIKAVEDKLEVLQRFKSTVQVIVDLVNNLTAFDKSLKAIDSWKDAATSELKDIHESSGGMLPEDRVARTMDLQEDIAAKLEILKANAQTEIDLLPQGDKVPADAQVFKERTLSFKALTSLRSDGLESPSVADFSALANQGANSLIPVLYSAQYLTSFEYLSHSTLVLAWRSSTYLVILASSSLKTWASAGTLSPCGRRSISVWALALRISSLAAMSS